MNRFTVVLVTVLVVLAAAAGGAWYWMKQRGGAMRRREENLGVVKFRKAEASQPEQLEGTQEMLKRRLESERATQRMQTEQAPAKPSQPEAAAPVQVNARIEPTLGEVKTQQTPAASGFNVAAAYVGDDKDGSSDEMPTAQATAEALRMVAEATNAPGGMNAVNLQVAEKYVEAFSKLAKEGNTLVVPANLGDLSTLITSAMSIVKAGSGTGSGAVLPKP